MSDELAGRGEQGERIEPGVYADRLVRVCVSLKNGALSERVHERERERLASLMEQVREAGPDQVLAALKKKRDQMLGDLGAKISFLKGQAELAIEDQQQPSSERIDSMVRSIDVVKDRSLNLVAGARAGTSDFEAVSQATGIVMGLMTEKVVGEE